MKKSYQNEKICVFWEPEKCIHSGNCLRGLPKVFDSRRRPWIDITAADAEEIVRCIDRCPSGALSYQRPAASKEGERPARRRTPDLPESKKKGRHRS